MGMDNRSRLAALKAVVNGATNRVEWASSWCRGHLNLELGHNKELN